MIGAFLNDPIMRQTDGSVTGLPDVFLQLCKVPVFVARQNWFSNMAATVSAG